MTQNFAIVRLAQDIARELGDGWSTAPVPNPDFGRDMHKLVDAYGNELLIDFYDGGERVALRTLRDHNLRDFYRYNDADPAKATVATSRGAKPMARKFEGMIPALREMNARARQRKIDIESQARQDHALATELAELVGNDREVPLYDRYGRREMLTRFEASYHPHKIEVQNGSVTMTLRGLSPDKARQIAALLDGEE